MVAKSAGAFGVQSLSQEYASCPTPTATPVSTRPHSGALASQKLDFLRRVEPLDKRYTIPGACDRLAFPLREIIKKIWRTP